MDRCGQHEAWHCQCVLCAGCCSSPEPYGWLRQAGTNAWPLSDAGILRPSQQRWQAALDAGVLIEAALAACRVSSASSAVGYPLAASIAHMRGARGSCRQSSCWWGWAAHAAYEAMLNIMPDSCRCTQEPLCLIHLGAPSAGPAGSDPQTATASGSCHQDDTNTAVTIHSVGGCILYNRWQLIFLSFVFGITTDIRGYKKCNRGTRREGAGRLAAGAEQK